MATFRRAAGTAFGRSAGRLSHFVKRSAASMLARLTERPGLRRLVFNALRLRRPEIMRLREHDEIRFLAHVFLNIDRSHSQILQDLWVVYELAEKAGGFFVEFGATDGRTNSNTWLLEHSLGWRGILAEPNPVWHADLDRNRRCAIDRRCVFARSGETVSFATTDDPELGGIVATAGHDHFAAVRQAAPTFEVRTVSLNDLLHEHGAPAVIDYMSIDTEGSELAILETFDFDRWQMQVLSIEHGNSPQEARIDALLSRQGYRRKFSEFSQWDAWYVRAG